MCYARMRICTSNRRFSESYFAVRSGGEGDGVRYDGKMLVNTSRAHSSRRYCCYNSSTGLECAAEETRCLLQCACSRLSANAKYPRSGHFPDFSENAHKSRSIPVRYKPYAGWIIIRFSFLSFFSPQTSNGWEGEG